MNCHLFGKWMEVLKFYLYSVCIVEEFILLTFCLKKLLMKMILWSLASLIILLIFLHFSICSVLHKIINDICFAKFTALISSFKWRLGHFQTSIFTLIIYLQSKPDFVITKSHFFSFKSPLHFLTWFVVPFFVILARFNSALSFQAFP